MSIQGSVNQLLGITAAASAYGVKRSQEAFAASRSAEYNKAYQANLEAVKNKYTKSGKLSKSAAAKETAEAAKLATPGPAPKAPWKKGIEEQLAGDYEAKMGKLGKKEYAGVKKLKETAIKGKEATSKQFGEYKELTPKILASMSPEERWKARATEKLMQKEAYESFLDSLNKGE